MTSERAATAATSSRGRPVYVHAAPLLCRACAQIIAPNPPVTCAGGAACSWPRYFHERCLSDDLKCPDCERAEPRRCTAAACKQPANAELETCGPCGRAYHRDCRVEHARPGGDDCGAHECLTCIEKERLYNSQLAKYNELKRDRKRPSQPKPLAVRARRPLAQAG